MHLGFVEIVSDDKIDVKMQYPIMGMKYAEESCLMRKEAAEKLYEAAANLPAGYRFRIWDAWRPFALQHELYEVNYDHIVREFHLENVSEEERRAVIRGFVSEPIPDRKQPPVHTTGGAIDLTILDENGNELDMGTGFDDFTEATRTDYFESGEGNAQVRDNRRLLYSLMTEAGFTNLSSEWCHYDYGDRFWAQNKELPAIYEGVFTKEEIGGNGEFYKG